MTTLFEAAGMEDGAPRPLADRLRPKSLDEVAGQEHLLGAGRHTAADAGEGRPALDHLLGTARHRQDHRRAADGRTAPSCISSSFPRSIPACKTCAACSTPPATAARCGQGTVLFVDEIHRFNRAQQDCFLPVMEDGTIILIGATTENPSFELNGALLSRATVLVFQRLDDDALEDLLDRAEKSEARPLPARRRRPRAARCAWPTATAGRCSTWPKRLRRHRRGRSRRSVPAELVDVVQRRAPLYDKNRDGHYDLISALHKSVRGSDPDAALYWLARMLDGGEDPLYIARRVVRMAVEDIGLADPQGLVQAIAAKDAYDFLGSPRGRAGASRRR